MRTPAASSVASVLLAGRGAVRGGFGWMVLRSLLLLNAGAGAWGCCVGCVLVLVWMSWFKN